LEKKIIYNSDKPIKFHFGHANGFYPDVYKFFLDKLEGRVVATLFKPFQKDSKLEELKTWDVLANEMIAVIERNNSGQKVIGMGHSMGASSTVLAAIKRPDLFEKLILIEPVLLPRFVFVLQKVLPFSIFKKMVPVAKIALKRKDKWADKQTVFDSWRTKKIFRDIPNEILKGLVEHNVVDGKNGVKLRYSKEWEAHIYATVLNIWPLLPKLTMPILAIRGAKTDVISDKDWALWKNRCPNMKFLNVENTGHLVPFEQPDVLIKSIKEFVVE